MEIKTFKCPSCGAQITNAQNCEYCGSLLVRFEAKDINVKNMSLYLNEGTILPGLLRELEQNLAIQEAGEVAVTDIIISSVTFINGSSHEVGYYVLPTSDMSWSDGQKFIPSNEGQGLGICVSFVREKDIYGWAKDERERHEKFKQLEFYNLFNHRTIRRNDGKLIDEYIIDFGKDAVGAAHLLSDLMRSLNGVDNTTNITYDTERWDIIREHRANRAEIRKVKALGGKADDEWLYAAIGVGVVSIIYFIFF